MLMRHLAKSFLRLAKLSWGVTFENTIVRSVIDSVILLPLVSVDLD